MTGQIAGFLFFVGGFLFFVGTTFWYVHEENSKASDAKKIANGAMTVVDTYSGHIMAMAKSDKELLTQIEELKTRLDKQENLTGYLDMKTRNQPTPPPIKIEPIRVNVVYRNAKPPLKKLLPNGQALPPDPAVEKVIQSVRSKTGYNRAKQ